MEKTAMQELIEFINNEKTLIGNGSGQYHIDRILKKAFELKYVEYQQIFDAFNKSMSVNGDEFKYKSAEQYYNSTFNNI